MKNKINQASADYMAIVANTMVERERANEPFDAYDVEAGFVAGFVAGAEWMKEELTKEN